MYPCFVREPYRETYRVERRTRELTDAEHAIARAHIDDWDRRVRAQHLTPVRRMFVAIPVAVLVAAFGVIRGNHALVATALLVGAFFAVIGFFARRDALKLIAISRGPWHPPAPGWCVIETHVFARSVIGAASDDEEYTHWLLYEIPGGTWFYLDPYDVASPPIDLARSELHLARLAPWGPYVSATSSGDPIPHRGATDTPDGSGFAAAVEAGHLWQPATQEYAESGADGLVEESALPAWVRKLVEPA
ncbi:MAG: hypothetical protein JWM74_2112 [Myxococcaceae bacterium]|nr:hypothetical protein [Myxococcaceae bacterium]